MRGRGRGRDGGFGGFEHGVHGAVLPMGKGGRRGRGRGEADGRGRRGFREILPDGHGGRAAAGRAQGFRVFIPEPRAGHVAGELAAGDGAEGDVSDGAVDLEGKSDCFDRRSFMDFAFGKGQVCASRRLDGWGILAASNLETGQAKLKFFDFSSGIPRRCTLTCVRLPFL